MKNLNITIMAAGEGKRMNSTIPKVLHLFDGVPMLVRIILEVLKLNPRKIIIITGKYDELIKTTIKEYINIDLINLIDLIYIQQHNPCGTGDAIKCTLDSYSDNEDVLILNGDMPLVSFELLQKFIGNSESNQQNAKLLVAKLDNPFGYGRILYDTNGRFVGIKEQKDCTLDEKIIDIVNVGIYFFNSYILKKYIPLIDNNNVQNEYYLTDIIKVINNVKMSNINIETYKIEENLKYQIYGINTQEELFELEKIYAK